MTHKTNSQINSLTKQLMKKRGHTYWIEQVKKKTLN